MNTPVLSVLSNLPKGQLDLRVGQEKQKTPLHTGQVDQSRFFVLALLLLLPHSLHAGVPATRNERRSEASREENGERERKKVLSLPLPILLAARFEFSTMQFFLQLIS